MNRLKTSCLTALAVALALAGSGYLLVSHSPDLQARPATSVPVVKFRTAQQRAVSDSQEYTGRLEAVDVVDVRPRVPGTLMAVHFVDGQQVHAGDLLFTIDPAPFDIQVSQSQARVAVSEEHLRLADNELARGRRLIEVNAIARKEFDALDNASREAAASLKGARAALADAHLQRSYAQVRAPISGRISRAEITVGNVLVAGGGAAPLTRIVSDSRLYASFNVDEQSYLRLIAPDLRHGVVPVVKVGLANEDGHPYSATIEALDNQMDVRSGTVRIRARIATPSPDMLPGLQARIHLQGGTPYNAVVVDDEVVGTDQDRKYVLIVNAQNKVERRVVELGALQGRERVLRRGIDAGSRVVVDGAYHASPGSEVVAVDADAPASVAATTEVTP